MDIRRQTTTTEARALIGMVQYCRDMWPRWSIVSAPLTEAFRGPKGRKIFWNDALENYFKEMKHMVSVETLLSYPDCAISFIVHTDVSDKRLCAVISQKNKPIAFFSRRPRKP